MRDILQHRHKSQAIFKIFCLIDKTKNTCPLFSDSLTDPENQLIIGIDRVTYQDRIGLQ